MPFDFAAVSQLFLFYDSTVVLLCLIKWHFYIYIQYATYTLSDIRTTNHNFFPFFYVTYCGFSVSSFLHTITRHGDMINNSCRDDKHFYDKGYFSLHLRKDCHFIAIAVCWIDLGNEDGYPKWSQSTHFNRDKKRVSQRWTDSEAMSRNVILRRHIGPKNPHSPSQIPLYLISPCPEFLCTTSCFTLHHLNSFSSLKPPVPSRARSSLRSDKNTLHARSVLATAIADCTCNFITSCSIQVCAISRWGQ